MLIVAQQLASKEKPPAFTDGLLYVRAVQALLTATHTISAIQTLVAGAAAHGDMSAGITCRRIALHALSRMIYCIHSV